jgi:hypothetical protein
MQTIEPRLTVLLGVALPRAEGTHIAVRFTLADVMAIFQAFEALDYTRLQNELLYSETQASDHKYSCFQESAGRVGVERFNQYHGEGRAGLCFPHTDEAAFMQGNPVLGCEDIANGF